jgi:uncharacterized protein
MTQTSLSRLILATTLIFLSGAGLLRAGCEGGVNLLTTMDPAKRTQIETATMAAPFPHGNLWQASRDGQTVTILGTYHLDDRRHDAIMTAVAPLLDKAGRLLVEAGPQEVRQLKAHMAREPGMMFLTQGPSLMEQLPPDLWKKLKTAMAARQVPGFMAAKFRPWFAAMTLSAPPCMALDAARENGLDMRLMKLAAEKSLSVQALEPYDTLFKMIDSLSAEDQIEMIEMSLQMENHIQDMTFTTAEEYFAQNSRVIWELTRDTALAQASDRPGFTKQEITADFELMEKVMLTERNAAWIPVIEDAADKGSVFVAFGALHLSGETGVLHLLEQNGWTIERLPL